MKLYDKKTVLADVANLAYVIADVREGEYDSHTLHQTFDICAPGNIDRARSTLDRAISRIDALLPGDTSRRGTFGGIGAVNRAMRHLRRCIHEYLVATVLVDWLEIAFPPMTAHTGSVASRTTDSVLTIWKEKQEQAWSDLTAALRTTRGQRYAFSRRVPPI